MKIKGSHVNVVLRNIAGVLALVLAHFLADQEHIGSREGLEKASPYIFLLLMYGWIVFHNKVLFERLYLNNRRPAYFGWTFLAMTLCSLNMHYIISTGFGVSNTMPFIISFWVYTIAGLGVFVVWRHLGHEAVSTPKNEVAIAGAAAESNDVFSFMVDGFPKELPYKEIHYVESLENYIRIITSKKPLVVRLSLKETELRLPAPPFIRISRSCIVNANHIQTVNGDTIFVHGKELKVGKVFKRYVEKFLK